jgi:hypothetical protein
LGNKSFILATLAVLVACGGALWWVLTSRPVLPPRPAWDFPRLPVEQVKAPVPARFSGPLPSQVEGFWEQLEKGPPLSHVRLRLLEGDREMSERFLSALRHAAAWTPDIQTLKDTYGEALWIEGPSNAEDVLDRNFLRDEGEPPCAWLREQLQEPSAEHAVIRKLFWWKLALCSGPETEALFAREEAPTELVIDQYFRFGPPRFTAAMDKRVRRVLAEDQQEFFDRAAALLSQSPEPAAQALAEQLARQARGELVEKLRETRANYQRQEEYYERECRELPVSPDGLDPIHIDMCLERWARADWPATARLASMLFARPGMSTFDQEAFAVLTRFASTPQRDAWAQERGLLPRSLSGQEAPRDSLRLASQMVTEKRAVYVNPSRLMKRQLFQQLLPLQHDDLLVTLAWMVHPELQGVVFEEVPPAVDARTGKALDGHILHAYADGERFSIKTLNQEYWQDVGAVLALLNRLLEVRGSTTRFAVFGYPASILTVVSGPAAALREADSLRLVQLGDAREVVARAMDADSLWKRFKEKAALNNP